MNGTLVIARREVVEKKFVFLTAVALAILPFAAALLPVRQMVGARGVIVSVAVCVAVAFTLGLALVLGSSMVGRELTERRLSFYFARPVSALSIWFGKLGAALFTLLASLAIILVPSMIIARNEWNQTFSGARGPLIGGVIGIAVLLLLFAHVLSTVIRSRSPLVAADFVLAAGAAMAVFFLIRPLFFGMAVHLINRLNIALLIGFAVAVVAAGAWQLADGRTDRRRSHAALSRVFWATIVAMLAIAAGFVAWVVAATPDDLVADTSFHQAPQGNWALISGIAAHRDDYRAGFLYDLTSGRYTRMSGGDIIWGQTGFNRTGTMATVDRVVTGGKHTQLVLLPLDREGVKPIETDLTFGFRTDHVLSDDAQRVAYLDAGIVSVYDLASKRSLASVRLPAQPRRWVRMFFVSPDVVRLYVGSVAGPAGTVDAYELQVPTRALTRTGSLPLQSSVFAISASRDGSTVVVRTHVRPGVGTVTIVDGRTLAPAFAYTPAPDAEIGATTPLADGTVLIGEARGGRSFARILRRDGSLVREIPLDLPGRAYFVAELPGNKVVLAASSDMTDMRSGRLWTTVVVDLARGAIERRAPRLRPDIVTPFSLVTDPRRSDPAPRLVSALDENKNIVTWNPETGEVKKIAKG